jgi:serine/threonine protein kinase
MSNLAVYMYQILFQAWQLLILRNDAMYEEPCHRSSTCVTYVCMLQGGFGKVYQVKRKETGKVYAMKCMRKDCVIKENLRGTKAERSILSSLRHPYIVNMYFAFQCSTRLYIVMDYFPGGQFLDMLQYHSPFDHEACRIYTAEIALALEELHRYSTLVHLL